MVLHIRWTCLPDRPLASTTQLPALRFPDGHGLTRGPRVDRSDHFRKPYLHERRSYPVFWLEQPQRGVRVKHSPCVLPAWRFEASLEGKACMGTPTVAQWIRIHLPMQGVQVRFLVQEDSTCLRATKPLQCNHWPSVPTARTLQQEKPWQWEAHAPQPRVAPLAATRESLHTTQTQRSQKIINK